MIDFSEYFSWYFFDQAIGKFDPELNAKGFYKLIHNNVSKSLIENKIKTLNGLLSDTSRGSIPPVTLSVSVAFGDFAGDVSEIID